MTPDQCRAARALINVSQDQLANMSLVSKRTIASFESTGRTPLPALLNAMQRALEEAGIEFLPDGGLRPRLSKE